MQQHWIIRMDAASTDFNEIQEVLNHIVDQVEVRTSTVCEASNISPSVDWKDPGIWLLVLQAVHKCQAHLNETAAHWVEVMKELGVLPEHQTSTAVSLIQRFYDYKRKALAKCRDPGGTMQNLPNSDVDDCGKLM